MQPMKKASHFYITGAVHNLFLGWHLFTESSASGETYFVAEAAREKKSEEGRIESQFYQNNLCVKDTTTEVTAQESPVASRERARGTIEAKSIPEISDRTIPLSEAGDFNSKKMNHSQGKEDRLYISKMEALKTDLRGLKKALPWDL
eukprot:scaffold787_cov285-Chaetoceros_neogracile.AAC.68